MGQRIVGRMPFYRAWKTRYSTRLKKRRFSKLTSLFPPPDGRPVKILEVGCGEGLDFLQFLGDSPAELWAVDIKERKLRRKGVHFVRADAENLPFEDGSFDLVVTIGLLEHIEPMEKLCKVIRELNRVGRHQLSVVPSISTPLEPHSGKLLFPLQLRRELCSGQEGAPLHLNFFSEHTWTKFEGFSRCQVRRFFYLPPLIRNTVIYK